MTLFEQMTQSIIQQIDGENIFQKAAKLRGLNARRLESGRISAEEKASLDELIDARVQYAQVIGSEEAPFDSTDTEQAYGVYVDGERNGRVWWATGVKQWVAMVLPKIQAVPRTTPVNTLEALLSRVSEDFKGKLVEFRPEA